MFNKFFLILTTENDHGKILDHSGLYQRPPGMTTNATITTGDRNLFLVTDDIDEAVALIVEKSIKQHGLKPKARPYSWLFEKK